MFTGKSTSRIFSVLFIIMFLLTSVLPMQTATASTSNTTDLPAGLSADEWTQIQSMLPAAAVPNNQQAYIKASNTDASDRFGVAISISGDTLVVGTPFEDSDATGVNGDQTDNSSLSSGAVYVFIRSGATWSQQAYLKASNAEAHDWFGWDVSVSGDTLVVGAIGEDGRGNGGNDAAPESGAVYIFTRSGTTWTQQLYLKSLIQGQDYDHFGSLVSLDGDTLAVGACGDDSNAIGVDGIITSYGAQDSGAVYVFTRDGVTWNQQSYLKASNTAANDSFCNVSLDGDTLVVGASWEDSNATGMNGNQADDSAPNSGAAYVFTRNGTTWSQQAYLKASNTGAGDWFGNTVSVSGDTLVVGAPFENSNATGVNGNQMDNSALNSGAAYVFTRSGTNWGQQAYLKASNTEADDSFGGKVSISGDTLVVGAYGEDSNAIGANGNGMNNDW